MRFPNNFFVVILIGGMGSRFSKINEPPKQLIKLNKKSLLENLILSFVKNGIYNFILPLGYKKKYFINFFKRKKIIGKKRLKIHENNVNKIENNKINIVLFDAGKTSSKLTRIKKSLRYINNNNFIVTYGDGIADINLKKYLVIFKKYNKVIVANKFLNSQYGHIKIRRDKVISFKEKPILQDPINIGYYFFSKDIFNKYYKKNYELENNFINNLIKNNQLVTYNHKGFFFNIDRKIDLINIKKKYKKIILTL